jgi:signal transduction histidine kinase
VTGEELHVARRAAPGASVAERLFAGPGELRAHCRALDWSTTPLGPVERWPQSLRTAVDLCLGSRFPCALLWGPELAVIHNEAHGAMLGARRPYAIGRPAAEVLSDAWHVLAAFVARTLSGVDGAAIPEAMPEPADFTVTLDRGEGPQPLHLIVSVGAVHDEAGRPAGVMLAAVDITARVLAEAALRESQEQFRRSIEEAAERAERARQELRRELAAAEEGERRRLSRELHDHLGQELTALRLGLDDARRLIARQVPPDAPVFGRLAQLEALAASMSAEVRTMSLELRPPELDDVGLDHALRTYAAEWSDRYRIPAEVTVPGSTRLVVPPEQGTTLYRIAQEALTNVARHARARHVSVILERTDGEARLIVEDDGRGFDATEVAARAQTERRLGLGGMRERAALVGGSLQIESTPGGGTTVFARLPMPGADRRQP